MPALPPVADSPLASAFALREAGFNPDEQTNPPQTDGGDSPLLEQEADEALRDSLDDRQTLADVAVVHSTMNRQSTQTVEESSTGAPQPLAPELPFNRSLPPSSAPAVVVQPGTDLSALLAQRLKDNPELLDLLLGKKPVRKKRAPRKRPETDALPPDQWLALARSYPDEESRALAALLFLCGPRVTEALAHARIGTDGKTTMAGFTRKDFWAESRDGHQFVVFRFVTLKRGDGKVRKNYVLADVEPERSLLALFLSWAQAPERSKPESRVFRFSRQNARNTLAQRVIEIGATRLNAEGRAERVTIHEFHPHPHWFRHCRLTDLSDRYNFNEQQQRAWVGWKTTSEASRYTHLQSEGLATLQVARIESANRETTVVLIEPKESSVPFESKGEPDEEEEEGEEEEDADEAVGDVKPTEAKPAELPEKADGTNEQEEDPEDEYF